ncbi:hypothetical protein PHYPO_G00186070 [Pangasianodon hypophthalmus]|uniref:Uncharacterized protein n=1 Tax=Pangasianodon hypophthalmus TaxID=310915 RepID=A0A5N5JQ06_PANHP|nr:hypothetical protein PHYPO_G00186070 [Pangasianodon hypophthalmus]
MGFISLGFGKHKKKNNKKHLWCLVQMLILKSHYVNKMFFYPMCSGIKALAPRQCECVCVCVCVCALGSDDAPISAPLRWPQHWIGSSPFLFPQSNASGKAFGQHKPLWLSCKRRIFASQIVNTCIVSSSRLSLSLSLSLSLRALSSL